MTQARFLLVLLAGLLATIPSFAAAPATAPTPEQVRFFELRIRPLLADNCFSCHGKEKQRSGLRLDSAEAIRKGGSSGEPLLVPGQHDEGLLLRAVRHTGGVAAMPPKSKLKDSQIADLARWVKMGAPFPQNSAVRSTAKHWAFQPIVGPAIAPVRDSTWAGNGLDRFILAALEKKGLRPSPSADRRTLLRRVTFDLTGLPPTIDEIHAFLNDSSPDAYARVVDRLLASGAYGERWGRHWLDVARYADSNGLDENIAHGNAWRYRDHVVAVFNRDQPYDQFVMEQVAGDLLPAEDQSLRQQRLIATGFLALGPKVLAEVDERKMELDIVDEQVDTLGRAFLGMTFGCARCHDHKFDPISLEDYHGLAGIFLSTKTMESFRKIARWHENPLASPQDLQEQRDHAQRIARQKQAIQEAMKKGGAAAKLPELRAELARLEKEVLTFPTAMGVTEGKVADAPLMRRGNHLNPGKPVARRFPEVLAGDSPPPPKAQSGRLELARWLVSRQNPLTVRVMVNRVWRWHFGQGLVRSVDNFGLLGEKPDHPELLDWLAARFIESGWSVKALHRLIVLSNTYQMSSAHDSRSAALDPDNRLFWRANIRRVEAEEIRDSLLATSGGLDRTMGGSLLHVKNREFLFDHTSRDLTNYVSPKRALYLPVIRNNLYDVFSLFDTTDGTVSSGGRTTTTVATQALFAMNSDLIRTAAERLAEQALLRPERSRLAWLYETAYGRLPSAREKEVALAAVARFEQALAEKQPEAGKRRHEAWTWLCHAVLAANEFVYVN